MGPETGEWGRLKPWQRWHKAGRVYRRVEKTNGFVWIKLVQYIRFCNSNMETLTGRKRPIGAFQANINSASATSNLRNLVNISRFLIQLLRSILGGGEKNWTALSYLCRQCRQTGRSTFPKLLTCVSGDGAVGFLSFSHSSCFRRKSFSTFSSSLKYLSM